MTRRSKESLILALLFLAPAPVLGVAAGVAGADEPVAKSKPTARDGGEDPVDSEVLFEQLLVVGAPDEAQRVPGSAHVITAEELERQGYADIHRVLRQTPGLNIQEEDGYGLRPNIGIRGTGVERSQKITLLEDGVLIAPAPYAAPSAYYSPTAGRMEGFEVRKGSGAIRQGPYTTGGAINYLSTSIPDSVRGRVSLSAGQEGLARARAWAGDSSERFGWLLETFQLETEGFKNLDGGGGTGFDLEDYLAKFRLNSRIGARVLQAFEVKLGKTEQAANETYLGLAQEDFNRTPYRRYPSSAGDRITTDHEQIQASYYMQPSDRWELTATVYRNDFFRNWFKLEEIGGVGVAGVLASPDDYADLVDVLRGERDSEPGELAARNNRRSYFSEGLQVLLGLDLTAGAVDHDFEIGLRRHRDQEDRFQEVDLYQMLGGRRVPTERGLPGSDANRIADAEATAFFVRDTVSLGRWTWTPGVRIESIDLMRRDFGGSDPDRSGAALKTRDNSLTEVIPGFGIGYRLSDDSNVFLGIHRGFSPPGPSSSRDVDAEESVNYELGWRTSSRGTSAELVGFFNDYENLLGNDTVSSGGQGTGDQFNGGRVRVWGLEAGFARDLAPGASGGLRLPFRLAYTYTAARFENTFESDFADWAPGVERGDELPFLPENQLHAGLSCESGNWAVHLDGNYSDAVRTRPGSGAIAEAERIDSRFVLDLRAELRLHEHLKVWTQVLNLTDEVYVAARRPAGLRPGRPRAALFGVSIGFAGRSSQASR